MLLYPIGFIKNDSRLFYGEVSIMQWAVGSGQWAVGSGQWAVGSGQWAVGSGQWAINYLFEYFK
jgi:hypothetical protein